MPLLKLLWLESNTRLLPLILLTSGPGRAVTCRSALCHAEFVELPCSVPSILWSLPRMEDLLRRFEEPDARSRWDSPLFELRMGPEERTATVPRGHEDPWEDHHPGHLDEAAGADGPEGAEGPGGVEAFERERSQVEAAGAEPESEAGSGHQAGLENGRGMQQNGSGPPEQSSQRAGKIQVSLVCMLDRFSLSLFGASSTTALRWALRLSQV